MKFFLPGANPLVVPLVPAIPKLGQNGRMELVPDSTQRPLPDLNTSGGVPDFIAPTVEGDHERNPCWRISNLVFVARGGEEPTDASELEIDVLPLRGIDPIYHVSVKGLCNRDIQNLLTVEDLKFIKQEDRLAVSPQSLEHLLKTLVNAGGEVSISSALSEPVNESDLLEKYGAICARPHRWQGEFAFCFNESGQYSSELIDKEFKALHPEERPTTVLATSASLSVLNSDERRECAQLILKLMEHSGVKPDGQRSSVLEQIRKDLIECRLTVPEKDGGVYRLRVNLFLDESSNQLFIVYDPWVKSSSRHFDIDGNSTIIELLKNACAEHEPKDGREFFLAILNEVASSNETEFRNLQSALSKVESGLMESNTHPSPQKHVTALRSLNYLRTRFGITARDLNNYLEDQPEAKPNDSKTIRRIADRFTEAQRAADALLKGHEATLDLAEVLSSRQETAERHNSDDIIRGGTVGIVAGTFSLIVWELSHTLYPAAGLGFLSAAVVGGYGLKIFARSRRQGLSVWESIKKVF